MTYAYPLTIKSAAKLLDEVKPNWFNVVDTTKIDMENGSACILGQIYGHYCIAVEQLFSCDDENEYDKVFGVNASVANWTSEILSRREKINSLDFYEALRAINNGQTVQSSSGDTYYKVNDRLVFSRKNSTVENTFNSVFTLVPLKFTLANLVNFRDLKWGQKFKTNNDEVKVKTHLTCGVGDYNTYNETKNEIEYTPDIMVSPLGDNKK